VEGLDHRRDERDNGFTHLHHQYPRRLATTDLYIDESAGQTAFALVSGGRGIRTPEQGWFPANGFKTEPCKTLTCTDAAIVASSARIPHTRRATAGHGRVQPDTSRRS
jgi:hypothetical protein